MTRKQAFNMIRPSDFIRTILPDELAEEKKRIVEQFYSWNHSIKIGKRNFPVEPGVLIIVIAIAVKYTKGDFNDVYLRLVFETLIEKRIYRTVQALDYLDKIIEQEQKDNKNKHEYPDWILNFDQIIKDWDKGV